MGSIRDAFRRAAFGQETALVGFAGRPVHPESAFRQGAANGATARVNGATARVNGATAPMTHLRAFAQEIKMQRAVNRGAFGTEKRSGASFKQVRLARRLLHPAPRHSNE
jgi:hypothetical protein